MTPGGNCQGRLASCLPGEPGLHAGQVSHASQSGPDSLDWLHTRAWPVTLSRSRLVLFIEAPTQKRKPQVMSLRLSLSLLYRPGLIELLLFLVHEPLAVWWEEYLPHP